MTDRFDFLISSNYYLDFFRSFFLYLQIIRTGDPWHCKIITSILPDFLWYLQIITYFLQFHLLISTQVITFLPPVFLPLKEKRNMLKFLCLWEPVYREREQINKFIKFLLVHYFEHLSFRNKIFFLNCKQNLAHIILKLSYRNVILLIAVPCF